MSAHGEVKMTATTNSAVLLALVDDILKVYVVPRSGRVPAWILERLNQIEEASERARCPETL